jgi:hypothetical protein
MGRATARPPVETPSELNAPLFRSLAEQLGDGRRRVVLDLGPASTAMLSLLGRSPCRVGIADLVRGDEIDSLNAAETAEERVALAHALLPVHHPEHPVDIVLCWDLPNYLQPAAMAALMSVIAARANVRAIAHALVVYSERSMPKRPGHFVPIDGFRLVNRAVDPTEVPAPRHSSEALNRNMGGFIIDRVRLLANGMQEYLFCIPD